MTMLYPNPSYTKMCYKGNALYIALHIKRLTICDKRPVTNHIRGHTCRHTYLNTLTKCCFMTLRMALDELPKPVV